MIPLKTCSRAVGDTPDGRVRRIRMAIMLFCLAAGFARADGSARTNAPVRDLSAVFGDDSGCEILLYDLRREPGADDRAAQWIMHVVPPDTFPMTFFLAPSGAVWTPIGLDASVPFRGTTLQLAMHGDAVSCRAAGADGLLEYRSDDGRAGRTTLNGLPRAAQTAEAEEVELRLMGNDYARTWAQLRRQTVRIEADAVHIISPAAVEPTRFARVRALDDDERAWLRARAAERRASQSDTASVRKHDDQTERVP
jgi:hypothetical protein